MARLVYTTDGASYVCSGTLIADRDHSTFIPYFLTANHCVNTQTVASTIQTYWFYRSTACNSGTRGDYRVTMRHGVSTVTTGARSTLGIIFHDAA